MHYGAPAPALWYSIPENERERRCMLSSDACIIDEQHFFVVGNLEIKVIGIEELFSWDVWVSLSKENFRRSCELWETPERVNEPAYFGWLSTSLPAYPETVNLKTMVHARAVGQRPFVEVEPTDHPLALEQRNGITQQRLEEVAALVLHRK
jgi:hypothetical protein